MIMVDLQRAEMTGLLMKYKEVLQMPRAGRW